MVARVTVEITPKLKKKFIEKTESYGMSQKSALTQLLAGWVEGEILLRRESDECKKSTKN